MMNINEVQKRIKQRPPFQMIEKVLEVEDGEYAKGIKCVSVNEPYFAGHFPDAPIMPVNNFSCEAFVNRTGRIPAPIHSFKN